MTVEILAPDDTVGDSLPVSPGSGAYSAQPETLAPGRYTARVTQRDDVGNEAAAQRAFEILGVPDVCIAAPEVPFKGTMGPDELDGTPGRDLILGMGGDDLIFGFGDADCLRGGAGADVITGSRGNDAARGGVGPDLVRGGPGRDTLDCGPGYDIARVGPGDTTVGCEVIRRARPKQRS